MLIPFPLNVKIF